MSKLRPNDALDAAGFPEATRELMYVVPIEDLVDEDAGELELEVTVSGVDGQACMAVGYLPDGPVTAGQQLINDGETRRLKKQLVKPGGFLVVALDQPGDVDVRVAGVREFDSDEQAMDGMKCFDASDFDKLELAAAERNPTGPQREAPRGADEFSLGELTLTPTAPDPSEAAQAQRAATMNQVLQQLDQLMAKAKTQRSATTLIVSGENVDTAIANYSNMISILRGSAYAAVLDGSRPLQSGDVDAPGWLEVANGIADGLNKTMGVVSRTSFTSLAVDAGENLSTAAAAAAAELPGMTKWVVAGVIAVALIVVFK